MKQRIDRKEFRKKVLELGTIGAAALHFGVSRQRGSQIAKQCGIGRRVVALSVHEAYLRDLERFSKLIFKSPDGCWLWQGYIKPTGYGAFSLDGQNMSAHRASWIIHNGPVPAGHDLHHTCAVKSCVNPSHLQALKRRDHPGTTGYQNSIKTHCPHGHEYTHENTYRKGKRRFCKTCQAASQKRYESKKV